jgi:hypothetical protein
MAIKKYRPAKRQDDPEFDRILNSFLSEEAEAALTLHEKNVRERYVAVTAIQDENNIYLDSEIVKLHMERTGVSRATAYRDLAAARELFGNITATTRQARRYAVLQLAKRGLTLAEKEGDAKAFAQQVRNLIMLEGLDKDDTTGLDPEQVQPPTFILNIQTPHGTVGIDWAKLKEIKDVDYQEISKIVDAQLVDEQKMLDYLNEIDEQQQ